MRNHKLAHILVDFTIQQIPLSKCHYIKCAFIQVALVCLKVCLNKNNRLVLNDILKISSK